MQIINVWYRFLKVNLNEKELENIIENEFSVNKDVAKERIKELKDIFISFDKWEKVDLVKDVVYCYINDKMIPTISMCGVIAELITKDLTKYVLNQLTSSEEFKKFILKILKYQNQKFYFMKQVLLKNETNKQVITDLVEINNIRNKYIHLKYLEDSRYNLGKLKEDTKKMLDLTIDLLNRFYGLKSTQIIGKFKNGELLTL